MDKDKQANSTSLSKLRRERERQELRTKIFDAARELFANHGYQAVTVRKIAESVNYTPTTIYSYFEDKESLIREIVAHDFKSFAKEFTGCANVEDPWQRLICAGRIFVSWGIAHPNHYRMMFMSPPPSLDVNSDLADSHGDPSHDTYAFLQHCIRDAIEKEYFHPDFSDEELLVQTLWAGMHGIVSLNIAKGKDAWISWRSIEEISDTMMNVMVRGLRRGGSES